MSDTAILRVEGLDVSYGRGHRRTRVLHGVSLDIEPGEIVGVIGETGSGKTTLARTILGLVPIENGHVAVDGDDVGALKGATLRRFRQRGAVQYVFQDPLQSLDPDLTVLDSVVEGAVIRRRCSRAELRRAGTEAIERVGLSTDLLDRLPSQISGGQRQRVVIARALINDPRLLILDEPVSALDASNRILMLELFRRLRDELGLSLMFISHDLGSVAGISDRIAVLEHGGLVEQGSTAQVIRDPQHPYTRLLLSSVPTFDVG